MAKVSVFDMNGALLIRKNCNTENINIEANNFETGMKILVVQVGAHFIVKKFIVY
jgi:hypothetical protein